VPCCLYGKLPARRDFIAMAMPHAVLNAWEPWLQGAISASRHGMGAGWTAAYLRAPIWRFWLGADIAGEALLGALMPSADGVGRYFPLTLFCRADHPEGLPPPEVEPFESWFGSAESFLLSTLSQDVAFEAVTAGLAALPEAFPPGLPASVAGIFRLRGQAWAGPVEAGDVAAALSRVRPLARSGLYAGMSYWWTAGGAGFPALALTCRGMPDPHLFSGFLTGRFDAHET
jgi:type VI secretion system protein ImpM